MNPTEAQIALRRGGWRLTPSRRRVVEESLKREAPFTAEEVWGASPSVGRATVYRTLRLLTDLGVLCKVVMEDGTPRYRPSVGAHHHHLVCVTCGQVEEFAHCVEAVLESLRRRTGFRLLNHRMEVYGLCPRCRGRVKERLRG